MKRIGKKLLFAIAMIFTLSMVAPEVVPITTATTVEAASVKLNYSKLTLYKGQKKQLKLKGTKKKAKWSSNRKTVVSVDKKGKITAKKKGTAVITAKVGKKRYKCRVTVKVKKKIVEVRDIHLNKKDITLTVGQTQKLTVKFTPANATNKKVKWSSDNPEVATVDSNGNVRAVSEGIASIWCMKSDDYGSGLDFCMVTVERDLTLSALAWITLDAASNYYYDTEASVKDMYVDTKGQLQIYFKAGSSYYWATATITDDPIYYWCYHPTIPNNKAIDVCLWRYGYTPDFKVDEMLTVSKVAYRKAQLKKQQDYIISK